MGPELDPGNIAVSKTDKVSTSLKVTMQWGSELLNKSLLKYKSDTCYEGTIYRQGAESVTEKLILVAAWQEIVLKRTKYK